MATVNPTITQLGADAAKIVWALDNTDADGAPVDKHWADYADRTVSVDGTFGGATITIQGSADGSSWASLSDPSGSPVAMTAADVAVLSETPLKTRPALTGGAGSTVNVTMVLRRNRVGY